MQFLVMAYFGILGIGKRARTQRQDTLLLPFFLLSVHVHVQSKATRPTPDHPQTFHFTPTKTGRSIENPFAWDSFDIAFENFAEQLARDTRTTADGLKEDRAAFLRELVHPPSSPEEMTKK